MSVTQSVFYRALQPARSQGENSILVIIRAASADGHARHGFNTVCFGYVTCLTQIWSGIL